MLDIRPFHPIVALLGGHYSLRERCLWGFVTAFVIGMLITPSIKEFLSKHRICQVFRTREQVKNLAILHESKTGVQTLGGITILIASLMAVAVWASLNDLVIVSLSVYLLCSLLGALDDATKITKGNAKGLTSWQKLFAQLLVTWGVWHVALNNPPIGDLVMNVGWVRILEGLDPQKIAAILFLFYLLVIAGTSNGVNITDGIDGLAITNIMQCLIFFCVVAYFSCDVAVSNWSSLTYIGGASEIAVMCACFAGGSLSFFMFNMHPASLFMGDMGAIGLGGLLAIIAILLKQPFMLILVGAIFVVDTISVAMQITSKRLFRRKIFLMAPLHHHFELKGYSERGIVRTAFIIQAICVIAAFFIIFHGYFERS